MSNHRTLAPIALFVYNRLENTQRVVEALQKNLLAQESELFIFSDAPKKEKNKEAVDKVRQYLKTIQGFKSVNIIERKEHFYIERNIIEGVTDLVNKYGKIIVLEDDGVSASNFLTYMNNTLDFYEDKKRVMHIASFTFIKMPADYQKTILWRYPENTGGGWGTWKDRWDKFRWFKTEEEALSCLSEEQKSKIELEGSFKCLSILKMKPITWDICWYIAIVCNNGLAVNPPRSIIKNIGLYGGTHFSILNRLLGKHPFETSIDQGAEIIFNDHIEENAEAIGLLKEFYEKLGTRKRDKALSAFIRVLVKLKITKALKKIISFFE